MTFYCVSLPCPVLVRGLITFTKDEGNVFDHCRLVCLEQHNSKSRGLEFGEMFFGCRLALQGGKGEKSW